MNTNKETERFFINFLNDATKTFKGQASDNDWKFTVTAPTRVAYSEGWAYVVVEAVGPAGFNVIVDYADDEGPEMNEEIFGVEASVAWQKVDDMIERFCTIPYSKAVNKKLAI